MRSPLARPAFVLVVLSLCASLVACGGKILEEPDAGASSSGGTSSGEVPGSSGSVTPEPPSQPAAPPRPPEPAPPAAGSVADACEAICHRNARCGAWTSDCNEYCESEIGSAAACSPQANAYIHCYADNLDPDACAALPPVCEDAYCAYARCVGKVVPGYCR